MSYCMYTTQGDITCNNTGLNHNQDLLANFPSVPPVHRAINSDPNPYPLTYVPSVTNDSYALARNPPIPNLISDPLAPVAPVTPVAPILNHKSDPFVHASDLFVRNLNPNPNSDYKKY